MKRWPSPRRRGRNGAAAAITRLGKRHCYELLQRFVTEPPSPSRDGRRGAPRDRHGGDDDGDGPDERDTVELVEHGLVEAFTDAVGLRALGLGARVIDVLDRK